MKSDSSLKWLFEVSQSDKVGIFWLTVLNSLISINTVIFALVLKNVIDAATIYDKHSFIKNTLIFTCIILLHILIGAFCRRIDEKTRSGIENKCKKRAYQAILTRDYAILTAFHTGELQNRMTNDTVVIADGMTSIFPSVVAMVVKLVCASMVLFMLDVRFALVLFIGGIILIFVTYSFRRTMKKLHKRVQSADGEVRAYLQETVENLFVIRSFGSEDRAVGIASEKMNNHFVIRMRRNLFSNLCNVGFSAVMNGGYLFGLVWCGLGILNGVISYGMLTAVLQLVNQIQQPFANITGYLPKYYSMLASAERLIELENLKPDAQQAKITENQRDSIYSNLNRLELLNVSFTYPRGAKAIVNESYFINKGNFIAITGQSGIGKSTILKLLLAMYEPDCGNLNFVMTDGSTLPITASTRPMFAYVPQGNFLMSGTIAETVSFMNRNDINLDRVKLACKVACADEFISELQNGYDTVLGEKGLGLSEGQIQRIAVARAIYFDAPILLLDEATSALDEITERILLENLRNMTDKTVIIVTHKKAAFDVCDKIICFEKR